MTDIALLWSNAEGGADLGLVAGQLATDDGLNTAILISLFTDAPARPDDALPSGEADGDRRGWWGDAFARPVSGESGDRMGSRLWLLERSKKTPDVLARARDYAREALAWLIADGIAARIDVEAVALPNDTLGIGSTVTRPSGARLRFDHVWEAI